MWVQVDLILQVGLIKFIDIMIDEDNRYDKRKITFPITIDYPEQFLFSTGARSGLK